jgi:hypothetical protein
VDVPPALRCEDAPDSIPSSVDTAFGPCVDPPPAARRDVPIEGCPMMNTATDALLEEIQELIREREREGVAGLAERVGPAEWAALVPRLDPPEVAVLLQWLPDEEIPESSRSSTPTRRPRSSGPCPARRRRRSSPAWTPTTPPTSSRT